MTTPPPARSTTEHIWGFAYAFFPTLCVRCHKRQDGPARDEPCAAARLDRHAPEETT